MDLAQEVYELIELAAAFHIGKDKDAIPRMLPVEKRMIEKVIIASGAIGFPADYLRSMFEFRPCAEEVKLVGETRWAIVKIQLKAILNRSIKVFSKIPIQLFRDLGGTLMCSGCGTFDKSKVRKRCACCKTYAYCNEECQRIHWHNGHREVCKPILSTICADIQTIIDLIDTTDVVDIEKAYREFAKAEKRSKQTIKMVRKFLMSKLPSSAQNNLYDKCAKRAEREREI